jgi:hypothetical protein
MAALAYNITTTGGTLPKLQRKVQGKVRKVFASSCEEAALIKRLQQFELNFSAREVTTVVDVQRQGGGASILEGGYEAVPRTVAPNEITFTWVNYNDRFVLTMTAKMLDQNHRQAELKRQIVYQTEKLGEGMANWFGYRFYGYSDGIVCRTSTNATQASGTYALIDAYGKAAIDNTTYLKRMFANGDRVALRRAGSLVTNAIGTITSAPTTAGIAVTWNGSVDSDANDEIIFAQSSDDAGTLAASTDDSKFPIGLFDAVEATSLHQLSSAVEPEWAAAGNLAAGGASLTGTMIMAARDEIANQGGGEANLLVLAQGVQRELFRTTSSALRFNDPVGMNISGSTQYTGIKQFSSRKTPPGHAWLMDSRTMYRWSMVPLPGDDGPEVPDYGSADKLQDRNALVFAFDYPFQSVYTNRGNIYQFSGLAEA